MASALSDEPGSLLVFGAAGGIGRAICEEAQDQGWHVVAADLSGRPQTSQEPHVEISADVCDPAQVARAFAVASAQPVPLRGVVNAAGIEGQVAPMTAYSPEAFARVLEVNVTGTFHVLRHAVLALAAGGGSIVTIGSTSSIRGRALVSGYVASKHAVLGLTRAAAAELLGTPIRVNCVLPGPTDTRMNDAITAAAATPDGPGHATGLGRDDGAATARPDQIARTVAFLLSTAASHVHGADWVVDAGATIR